jgi:hypothetical protein
MSTILLIQQALVDAYENIELPDATFPTGLDTEPDDNYDGILPAVVIFRGLTISMTRLSANAYKIEREFIARLYTGILNVENDAPSVNEALLEFAASTVEPVEDYFMFTDDRLSNTPSVMDSIIRADTADTDLFSRDNRRYIGAAFSHIITYRRTKTTT